MLDDESIRTARIDGGALGHWFQNVDAVYLQPIFGNDHAVGTHSPGGSPHKKGVDVNGTAAREIELTSRLLLRRRVTPTIEPRSQGEILAAQRAFRYGRVSRL